MFEALGVITATTTAQNQLDTAVPFTIPVGTRVMVQPDVACFIKLVAAAADKATSSATGTSVGLDAGEKFEFTVGNRLKILSGIVLAGTVNLKVFTVYSA